MLAEPGGSVEAGERTATRHLPCSAVPWPNRRVDARSIVSPRWRAALYVSAAAFALGLGSAAAHEPARPRPRNPAAYVKHFERTHPHSVQLVDFKHKKWAPVRVVRGGGWKAKKAPTHRLEGIATAEIVRFPDPGWAPVSILRGARSDGAVTAPALDRRAFQRIVFADPHLAPVTIVRGPSEASAALLTAAFEPFGPASADQLDRVAFAVDGAESSHGTNPAMWRPDFGGPQGPMQVSLAAAADVGGGNRFDLTQNRRLGRAYLAHLYRRYGDWPDAIAAYNWGPGNVDGWIAQGRPPDELPLETKHYMRRVLRAAGLQDRIPLPAIAANH